MGYLEFYKLPVSDKLEIFDQVQYLTGLPPFAIEKDWWVVRVLEVLFQTEIKNHLVFKGGTSLSKAWGLIDRFSEDIDLALDRTFLGYDGEITRKKQVTQLRKSFKKYILDFLLPKLVQKLESGGLNNVKVKALETTESDQDPIIIEIIYPNITEHSEYLLPRVLVEIGCRSLREPYTNRAICSIIGEEFKGRSFEDQPVHVPSVNPERTFLEKLFLLHEEFQRPADKIRVKRLSRHLYDIYQISKSDYGKRAIDDHNLFAEIVKHRSIFSKLGGVDYNSHFPPNLRPIPPSDQINEWKRDYSTMQSQMVYGKTIPFEELLESVSTIAKMINSNSKLF